MFFVFIFSISFALLAGLGLQDVLKERTKKIRKEHAAVIIAGCFLFFSFLLLNPPPIFEEGSQISTNLEGSRSTRPKVKECINLGDQESTLLTSFLIV